jgi:hypothetical protein
MRVPAPAAARRAVAKRAAAGAKSAADAAAVTASSGSVTDRPARPETFPCADCPRDGIPYKVETHGGQLRIYLRCVGCGREWTIQRPSRVLVTDAGRNICASTIVLPLDPAATARFRLVPSLPLANKGNALQHSTTRLAIHSQMHSRITFPFYTASIEQSQHRHTHRRSFPPR